MFTEETIIIYRIKCDECGDRAEGTENGEYIALFYAKCENYIVSGEKHFCSSCADRLYLDTIESEIV